MTIRKAVLKVKKGPQQKDFTLADAISEVAKLPALTEARSTLDRDQKLSIEGVWSGSVAPLLAGWNVDRPRTVLVLTPQLAEAESIAAEYTELTGSLADVFFGWRLFKTNVDDKKCTFYSLEKELSNVCLV